VAILTVVMLAFVVTVPLPFGEETGKVRRADCTGVPAHASELTLSFDAQPADCEWDSIQPGFSCANGAPDHSSITQSPSAAFVRDNSPGNVRHGEYSARVVLNPGDYSSYSCQKEAVMAIKGLGEGEGSESWWGWSWKLPVGWRGTDSWGMLFEFTAYGPFWPSYGMLNFDAATRDSLRLGLHTGLTPNPGSGSYNAAYEKWVTLLGPGAPRPMVYGKWLDFYMHVVWHSRTSGVLQLWYRVEGEQQFRKLYSDVPGGGALIQVPPHPTMLYNTENGAPGENGKPGLGLEGGFYRANTPWTNEYWWDGMRRRQSESGILTGFPSPAPSPATPPGAPPPPPSGPAPPPAPAAPPPPPRAPSPPPPPAPPAPTPPIAPPSPSPATPPSEPPAVPPFEPPAAPSPRLTVRTVHPYRHQVRGGRKRGPRRVCSATVGHRFIPPGFERALHSFWAAPWLAPDVSALLAKTEGRRRGWVYGMPPALKRAPRLPGTKTACSTRVRGGQKNRLELRDFGR
jgi:Polysaccharide lyase